MQTAYACAILAGPLSCYAACFLKQLLDGRSEIVVHSLVGKLLLNIPLMNRTYQASLWSQMAEEARAVASRLHDDELRLHVRAVASRYEALAKQAEGRTSPGKEEPK